MYGFVLFPFNQRSNLRKEMKVRDSQTIQTKILDKLPEGWFAFLPFLQCYGFCVLCCAVLSHSVVSDLL